MHAYVSEHKVSPYYRTARRIFMKLGRDEVLMAPHTHLGVSARSTQGRIVATLTVKITLNVKIFTIRVND